MPDTRKQLKEANERLLQMLADSEARNLALTTWGTVRNKTEILNTIGGLLIEARIFSRKLEAAELALRVPKLRKRDAGDHRE